MRVMREKGVVRTGRVPGVAIAIAALALALPPLAAGATLIVPKPEGAHAVSPRVVGVASAPAPSAPATPTAPPPAGSPSPSLPASSAPSPTTVLSSSAVTPNPAPTQTTVAIAGPPTRCGLSCLAAFREWVWGQITDKTAKVFTDPHHTSQEAIDDLDRDWETLDGVDELIGQERARLAREQAAAAAERAMLADRYAAAQVDGAPDPLDLSLGLDLIDCAGDKLYTVVNRKVEDGGGAIGAC